MSKWHEYDPATGMNEINVADETDFITVHKYQDVTAVLDNCAEVRATRSADGGIKRGLWAYCTIPIGIQYELLTKYGLNIHNKNHTDRIFDVINRDYPKLKYTDKHHSRKRRSS